MSAEHGGDGVSVLQCTACGHLTVIPVLRCARCQSSELRRTTRPGTGKVAATTWTDQASFAIVDLDAGLQVLAIGAPRVRLAIGDQVAVTEHGDGTYDMIVLTAS